MKHTMEQMREFVSTRPWLKTTPLDTVDHIMTEFEPLYARAQVGDAVEAMGVGKMEVKL